MPELFYGVRILAINIDLFRFSSSSASHPTGTTFRIQNFLQSLPVRKQRAKKTSSNTFSKINKLLKSYAFARPHVRFSLRVLRAKNEKANWDYSPRIGKTCLLDVTAKVVGRDVAALCVVKSLTEQLRQPESSQAEPSYSIEAALPKACEGQCTF
jgi:DNA mismatch repair ATPase MutL